MSDKKFMIIHVLAGLIACILIGISIGINISDYIDYIGDVLLFLSMFIVIVISIVGGKRYNNILKRLE